MCVVVRLFSCFPWTTTLCPDTRETLEIHIDTHTVFLIIQMFVNVSRTHSPNNRQQQQSSSAECASYVRNL